MAEREEVSAGLRVKASVWDEEEMCTMGGHLASVKMQMPVMYVTVKKRGS